MNTVEQTFTDLVTSNQGIIHKICNAYCEAVQDREDLFQEIVLQLWRSYPSFDLRKNTKFTTWMYKIALNTAITSFRKSTKRGKHIQITDDVLQIPNIHSANDDEEQLKLLYQAIQHLSEVERAVILLYLEDHSYREMAEITGISESNVGVRINRIKKKLTEVFEKWNQLT